MSLLFLGARAGRTPRGGRSAFNPPPALNTRPGRAAACSDAVRGLERVVQQQIAPGVRSVTLAGQP
jgi:hypothetical protein